MTRALALIILCAAIIVPPSVGQAKRSGGVRRQPEELDWHSISLSFNDKTQSKYESVLDLGVLSSQDPNSMVQVLGPDPAGGICFSNNYSPVSRGKADTGDYEFEISISNLVPRDRVINLAYRGSRVLAYWPNKDRDVYDSAILPSSGSLPIRIRFSAQSGVQDLNHVALLEHGKVIADIELDYTIVDAPLYTVVAYDSGRVLSGSGKGWAEYLIGTGPSPYLYRLAKACLSVTGDRPECGKWSTCGWIQHDDSDTLAKFGLQGHDDEYPLMRVSEGHLRAAYILSEVAPQLR